MSAYIFLRQMLEARLDRRALDWFRASASEIGEDVPDARFSALLSLASRWVKPRPLAPTDGELAAAQRLVEGWSPERWDLLETARVGLVLARGDLAQGSTAAALEEAFRFADEGELRALYRSLALLPEPRRFAWRAGEGCRTNMRSVFEATALDTPFPAGNFDDVAWRQAVIKCVFVEAPLWRMWGLDGRLSAELARMALDLADERRSAGRPVQRDLWLCLGADGGERALASILRELDPANANAGGRRAAGCALARAGRQDLLEERLGHERDPLVAQTFRDALEHGAPPSYFRQLDPNA